ncbi:MAG: heme exporter protein CcmB [Eggerthellaceae bacterium]|nr:heme exporter protein CcmB [Eggerthellaceae bacterium]
MKKPSGFSHYLVLVRKDVLLELHTFDLVTSMGLYAVLAVVVYGAACAQAGSQLDILRMAGGLLWAALLFTSLLGLSRSFAREGEGGCLEGLLLVPMDRSVIFLAKATANLVFLLVVEAVTVPLFAFFLLSDAGVAPSWPYIVPVLVLGAVGIAGVGTMLSTITANTRGKDVMLAVLFIPLMFPLLWACVSATGAALCGAVDFAAAYFMPLALAGGYDVIMLAVCWLLYDFVVAA